jgi:hypothetical protein
MPSVARRILLAAGAGVLVVAVALTVTDVTTRTVGAVTGLAGLACLLVGALAARRPPDAREESDDVTELGEARRRELMRGTSLYLREMRYRYSVRLDTREARDRRPFAAEVNTIRLGFLPAIVTDNTTDRQGLGFVAFVHDGTRWRGPGLPCPADQADAVRHAARCVSPLATEDETKYL